MIPETLEEDLNEQPDPDEDALLIVDSLEQFAAHVIHWHAQRVSRLRHMLEVPEGTEMEYNGRLLQLSGDVRDAFLAGVTVALAELGELPFQEVEPVDHAPTH